MASEEVFIRCIEQRNRCRGDESPPRLTNVSVAFSIRPPCAFGVEDAAQCDARNQVGLWGANTRIGTLRAETRAAIKEPTGSSYRGRRSGGQVCLMGLPLRTVVGTIGTLVGRTEDPTRVSPAQRRYRNKCAPQVRSGRRSPASSSDASRVGCYTPS